MKYDYPTTQKVLGVADGRRHQIKCPSVSHNDSTASFTIYSDGSFYCFGCAVHGANGLAFLIDVLGNSLPESMKYLDERKLLTKL